MKDRTISIFNSKYRIKFVKRIEPEKENTFCFGKCDPSASTILISTEGPDGKALKDGII